MLLGIVTAVYRWQEGKWQERQAPRDLHPYGGVLRGSPAQFESQARHFANRGMIAITADYRVKSRQGVQVVECVNDAKAAIAWVRENAGRLGIDPDKIAASGGSAGGHLAASTGTISGFGSDERPNAMIHFRLREIARWLPRATAALAGLALPLPWADLSGPFGAEENPGGGTLFSNRKSRAGQSGDRRGDVRRGEHGSNKHGSEKGWQSQWHTAGSTAVASWTFGPPIASYRGYRPTAEESLPKRVSRSRDYFRQIGRYRTREQSQGSV
ncbi:MAG: alpha/beta hydrolase [Thermoguttaceae bacterium]